MDKLNGILETYIQKLHNDKAPQSNAIECLAALQMARPALQGRLHPAWKAAREWGKSLPVSVRCPMPLAVALALAVTAWTLEWRRSALCLLLGFEGLLRPMEMRGALRCHLALPSDLTGDPTSVVMAIPESKTSTRTVKMQFILVTDYKLVALLDYIFARDAPRTPLCPGGLRGLQRQYLYLKVGLGIESSPWTLGSIRGGGAVEFMAISCEEHKTCSTYNGRVAGATLAIWRITYKHRWASRLLPLVHESWSLRIAHLSSSMSVLLPGTMTRLVVPVMRSQSRRNNGGVGRVRINVSDLLVSARLPLCCTGVQMIPQLRTTVMKRPKHAAAREHEHSLVVCSLFT
eukprot:6456667-Amphidinium_carterae.2